MSNFPPLKNVPPILQNQSAETLWKALRQPFSLAVLASLGVHTLLWFGLPLLPSSSAKQPEQRTLSVVELSPLEQAARLPQTSPNQPFNLSPKPNSSKSSNSTASSVPMVPLDPTLVDPNTYYQIPDTSNTDFTTGSTSDTSSTRSKPDQTKRTGTDSKKTENQTKKPDKTEDADETQPEGASNRAGDLTSPDGKGYSKSRDDQDKLAVLQKLFAYNAAGTSSQDISDNMKAAGDKIAETFNVRDWKKPIAVRAAYPKDACQFQHEGKPIQGTTGFVVVYQPDGTLADTVVMLKSSGFKGLDESARQFVEKQWGEIAKQNNLEPDNKNPQAFPLEIKFEPTEEECAGATKPVS
ncbi:MAG: energy transducer TonB [Oscillatoriales cyanobacterium C42_A2020_001]|nr:energy transducer TonB [Leptolyngbyaceae cyanobacterium C42_A2020_001]